MSIVGFWLWNRVRFNMGMADEKKARAEWYKSKAEWLEKKGAEGQNIVRAQGYMQAAAESYSKAAEIELERRELAQKIKAELPDGERARRFNARHGLAEPPEA